MITDYRIIKTLKQVEAVRVVSACMTTLLEGGSRSGKTFIICYIIIVRALKYSGTRHLLTRFRFAHAKQAICYDTMPKVLEMCGLKGKVHLNKTDWFYTFDNESTIWIGGLDDKERTEKILGNEYSTICLNEASQISFEAYETILTRLNPPKGVNGKILIDYNPPSKTHWGYKIFHKREYPDGRPVAETNFKHVKMNPEDNKENNSDGYMEMLETLSSVKRKRFLKGEYADEAGKLWIRGWIKYWSEKMPDFKRVVVGVDPSGSVEGDAVGIIAVGVFNHNGDDCFMVLDDYSLNGTPNQWANETATIYNKHMADKIVAEKNYGGLMVESTIKNSQKNLNVDLVNSSRGKVVRAEPVSAIYEQGRVFHRIAFMELEDEMCTYDPMISDSPNRMDALVFAITELAELNEYAVAGWYRDKY